ncbi:hypothetical protein Q757_03525 [Oenococcus alcoholitolerans]|uniref:Fluoride-specific ion channel n=1 Tax=Oenococcus alcoholitolerans TaxID=931074 RepID=A0ABR4XRB8_9LACO|nr:hypothetical protein Q757_03525 [Oenococcus alcoholitolerans]
MLLELVFISALGSAVGAEARYFIARKALFKNIFDFSLATLFINIFGSFCLGIVISLHLTLFWQTFLGSGIVGGFTTFSTFILETVNLFQRKTSLIQ